MAFVCAITNARVPALENITTLQFNKVLIGDSITEFFPKMEFQISDKVGLFSDHMGFLEGETYNIKFGYDDIPDNLLTIQTYWDDSQLPKPYSSDYISGDMMLYFRSINQIKDYSKSKSFKGLMSQAVTDTTASYGFTKGKTPSIENTTNYDYWYQPAIQDFDWISAVLVKKAVSQSNSNEPYFTFIDLNNQFHFRTLSDMMMQQSIANIFIGMGNDVRDDLYNALAYEVVWTGVSKDVLQWNSKYYYHDSTGTLQMTQKTIEQMPVRKIGKLPIQRSLIKQPTSIRYYGTAFDKSEKENFNGWINSFYREQQAMMSLRIVLRGAHPTITSGSVVNLDVPSAKYQHTSAREYSGKWVVSSCTHFVDFDHIPFTELWLMRNSIEYDPQHLYYQDLL